MKLEKRFQQLEQVLEVLLEAKQGYLDESIPIRATASPIHPSSNCFYVQAAETRKLQFAKDEMRVKYNNVVRSKIWWSPKHDLKIGLVSRAMSMKTRSESEESDQSFQHGFQGHWVSLLMRDVAGKEPNKAVVRKYVQEDVPGLVQFWSAMERGSNNSTKKEKKKAGVAAAKERRPSIAASDSESSDYFYASTPKNLKARGSTLSDQDFIELADIDLPSADLTPLASPDHSPDQQPYRRVLRNGKRGPPIYKVTKPLVQKPRLLPSTTPISSPKLVTNNDLEIALECIMEEGEKDGGSHKLAAPRVEESEKDACTAMFELFKRACDVLDEDEFPVFYERHCGKLFNQDMAEAIKKCLVEKDPRLSPDFLFPPESVGLRPERLIASGIFKGTYASGFELLKASKELAWFVGAESVKKVHLYEKILDSKIQDMFSHLVWKKRYPTGFLPKSYMYQAIARVKGERIVLRAHCFIDHATHEMEIRMQDCSDLYPELLALPPLPY